MFEYRYRWEQGLWEHPRGACGHATVWTTLKHCLTWTVFHLLVWGFHPIVFIVFTELWTVCFAMVCSGWSSDCAGLATCWRPVKPSSVWFGCLVPLGYVWACNCPLILEESCPAQGWQRYWEIDEQAGLWLGGTLQRCSWLRGELFIKDKYCYSISANYIYCFMSYDEHVNAGNVYGFASAECFEELCICVCLYV